MKKDFFPKQRYGNKKWKGDRLNYLHTNKKQQSFETFNKNINTQTKQRWMLFLT